MWKVEYNKDTNTHDKYYWEWWIVTNGERSFECDNEDDAEWLCKRLNEFVVDERNNI